MGKDDGSGARESDQVGSQMTPADKLASLRSLLERMTPGPWRTDSLDYVCGAEEIIGDVEPRDREGIIALRNEGEALLSVAEAALEYLAARDLAYSLAHDLSQITNGTGQKPTDPIAQESWRATFLKHREALRMRRPSRARLRAALARFGEGK